MDEGKGERGGGGKEGAREGDIKWVREQRCRMRRKKKGRGKYKKKDKEKREEQ